MTLSIAVFSIGGLIHFGLILSQTPLAIESGQLFSKTPILAALGILAGIFEGIGAAWFIFFLLRQAVCYAIIRLCLFFFLILSAAYGAAYIFTQLETVTQLIRATALSFGIFISLPLFFVDLFTSLVFTAVKKSLSPAHRRRK